MGQDTESSVDTPKDMWYDHAMQMTMQVEQLEIVRPYGGLMVQVTASSANMHTITYVVKSDETPKIGDLIRVAVTLKEN